MTTGMIGLSSVSYPQVSPAVFSPEALGKQLVPGATPAELQAVKKAVQQSQQAGIDTFQRVKSETGNVQEAHKQMAESLFRQFHQTLTSDPNGQAFINRGNKQRGLPLPNFSQPTQ